MINPKFKSCRSFLLEILLSDNSAPSLNLKIWESNYLTGFNICEYNDDCRNVVFVSPIVKSSYYHIFSDLTSSNFNKNSLVFEDAFLLIFIDRKTRKVHISNDRLGTFPIYYKYKQEIIHISPLVSLLLRASGESLRLSMDGLRNYLTFGYCIPSFPFLYEGIERMAPAEASTFSYFEAVQKCSYWKCPEDYDDLNDETIINLCEAIKNSIDIQSTKTLGITAGKDSLALFAIFKFGKSDQKSSLATYGKECSSGVLQGNEIANCFGLKIYNDGLVGVEKFFKTSEEISFFSSGLANLSFADMLAFMQNLPKDMVFIMGDGGECVRDFFKGNDNDFISSLRNYITPETIIQKIVRDNFYNASFIIEKLSQRFKNVKDKRLNFYRYYRMPGNFSLKNSIFFPFRNKISPFLCNAFMEQSYSLNPKFYSGSNIHRRIIHKSNKQLLKYFDNPYKSSVSNHDWENRIHKIDFWSIYEPYVHSTTQITNILNFAEIKKLIDEDRKAFSRPFYLYARLGSLILFLNRHEEFYDQYLGNEFISIKT